MKKNKLPTQPLFYCEQCGGQLVQIDSSDYFDPFTGQKYVGMACPVYIQECRVFEEERDRKRKEELNRSKNVGWWKETWELFRKGREIGYPPQYDWHPNFTTFHSHFSGKHIYHLLNKK